MFLSLPKKSRPPKRKQRHHYLTLTPRPPHLIPSCENTNASLKNSNYTTSQQNLKQKKQTHLNTSTPQHLNLLLVEGGFFVTTGHGEKSFIPLQKGDTVVHQSDLLHGVHVTSGEPLARGFKGPVLFGGF